MAAAHGVSIDLALQGGGSHGAFTWGVLDRLLEADGLPIAAISGTSAGALNAAVLATGHARGGRDGARAALTAFWRDVSKTGAVFSPFSASTTNGASNPFSLENLPNFNTGLIGEMRAIHFVSRLLRGQKLDAGRYKDLRMHMIADDDGLAGFNASSKFNTELSFLEQLFALGRDAASGWLAKHRKDVGVRASLDIEKTFLSPSDLPPRLTKRR